MVSWAKKIRKWCLSVVNINRRLKTLEDMHFGNSTHPGDICPKCGKHTVRHKIEKVHETVFAHRYEHIQNTVAFCSDDGCGYEETISSRKVQTDTPQTKRVTPEIVKKA